MKMGPGGFAPVPQRFQSTVEDSGRSDQGLAVCATGCCLMLPASIQAHAAGGSESARTNLA